MIRQVLGRLKTGLKALAGVKYDALDLLRADHMKVEALAVELRVIKNVKRRKQLLAEIRDKLDRHMRVEEEILYPACARIRPLAALVDHARTDHQIAKNALKDLAVMNPAYGSFSALVTTLIKEFEHHVYEEENRIFPGLRRHLDRKEFRQLSQRIIQAYRQERGFREKRRAA
jgi:iron-sulfur cluster repair protein YtfE (RIC family)